MLPWYAHLPSSEGHSCVTTRLHLRISAVDPGSDPRRIPARLMPSCFTFFQTHSSGLSSGEYPGRKNNFSRPSSDATYSFTGGALCTLRLSRIRNTGPGASCMSFLRNSTNTVASQVPKNTSKCSVPPGETAEIILTDLRSPVTATTGVCPTGAHVVPAW